MGVLDQATTATAKMTDAIKGAAESARDSARRPSTSNTNPNRGAGTRLQIAGLNKKKQPPSQSADQASRVQPNAAPEPAPPAQADLLDCAAPPAQEHDLLGLNESSEFGEFDGAPQQAEVAPPEHSQQQMTNQMDLLSMGDMGDAPPAATSGTTADGFLGLDSLGGNEVIAVQIGTAHGHEESTASDG